MMNIFSYDIIKNYYNLFISTIGATTKNEKCNLSNNTMEHDIYITEVNANYCIAKEKCIGNSRFFDGKLVRLKLCAYNYIPTENSNVNDIHDTNIEDTYCIIYDNNKHIFYCLTGEYKQKILDIYVAFKEFNTNTKGK